MTSVEGETQNIHDGIKAINTSQRNPTWALIGILGTAVIGTALRFIVVTPMGSL